MSAAATTRGSRFVFIPEDSEVVEAVVVPNDLVTRVADYARRYGITTDQAVVHALETMLADEPPLSLRPQIADMVVLVGVGR